MAFRNHLTTIKESYIPAILNSYSILFFLNNRWMAFGVMAATFLNFYAGVSGLFAVLLAVALADKLGFDKQQLRNGVYTFNALITGIGLGTFFDPGIVFFVLLALASIITLILSVALGGWFFKYGLPFLSIPFVLTFWIIVLPSSLYENLGLTQRNIFWMNELYSVGGKSLLHLFQQIESWDIHHLPDIYLRSLSSVFFQDNIIAGFIIAIALLISSRIFFSLTIIGFLSAYGFALFAGTEAASITYYNIGANFMMVAIAVGGFFIIPSKSSYLWTILLVPITSIALVFLIRLFGFIQMPVFSLPYTFVTIFFIHFLKQRASEKNLVLTPLQSYSPEINLYSYQNNRDRLSRFLYFPLQLPFWGEWSVSQGYDGAFTHKDEWGKALDFMILDDEGKSYRSAGLLCEDYYCFGKPVTAPADGYITEIQDNIEDNQIGDVNTTHNWGNSIVIQHINGVYTQLSHLKNKSLRVKKGDFVKQGDLLALCGNSGRSPYPHLHFQVQSQPYIGSKTISYPISYYLLKKNANNVLCQFDTPQHLDKVSNLKSNTLLFNAFNFIPDTILAFEYKDENGTLKTEHWEVCTDAYNYKYLYSKETEAVAYFTCDHMMFYFTAFYGSRKSLLHFFYLSAFKVILGDTDLKAEDKMPVHMLKINPLLKGINDISAPFHNFVRAKYNERIDKIDHTLDTASVSLITQNNILVFGKESPYNTSRISIDIHGISEFTFSNSLQTIHAKSKK